MKNNLVYLRDINFMTISKPLNMIVDDSSIYSFNIDNSLMYSTEKGKKLIDLNGALKMAKKSQIIFS